MSVTPATRFAPSPTGLLHVGNARTALIAWLAVRQAGGRYLLRIDDTDLDRSEEPFVEAIRRDLAWLGLDWDEEVRQSDRTAAHAAAIERLKADGRLYPCYETAEELALKRRSRLAAGKPPVYDRAALDLAGADRARLEAQGRRPHWRFKLAPDPIGWEDRVRGPVAFDPASLSDPVVIREDGRPLYHLCSVVDDIDLGITEVVRGEDHVANTATHVQMAQALDAAPPRFAHLPLLADAEGKPLSKRLGSLSLEGLREAGIEPLALVALLARLGTADPVVPVTSFDPLVEGFDFGRFSRATPKFDLAELDRLNARVIQALPFDAVAGRLRTLGLTEADAAFWEAVRPNLSKLDDATGWWAIARDPVDPVVEEPEFLSTAAARLPPEPWGPETWGAWTETLKAETGRKGKALFLPLRLALTGQPQGPELKDLLPLIGRARAAARLSGQTA